MIIPRSTSVLLLESLGLPTDREELQIEDIQFCARTNKLVVVMNNAESILQIKPNFDLMMKVPFENAVRGL